MLDKRVAITILLAVVISTLIGFFYTTLPTDELMKRFFTYKIHHPQKYQLLISGDSRVYRGISAKVFENTLGLSSFNLGFSSTLYDEEYLNLIDEKLDFESEKKVLVLGITPHSLLEYAYPNGHIKQIKNMKREEVIDYLYLFPLKRFYSSFNASELGTSLFNEHSLVDTYIQDYKYKEGWVASDYLHRNPYYALKSYSKTFTGKHINQKNLKALFAKINEWHKKGVEVYGFIPPSSVNIEVLERNKTSFDDSYIVKEFIANGGKWLTINNIYHTYDGSHLYEEEALKLSKELSDKIRNNEAIEVFDSTQSYRASYEPMNAVFSYFDDMESRVRQVKISEKAISGNQVAFLSADSTSINYPQIHTSKLIKEHINTIVASAYIYAEQEAEIAIVFKILRNTKLILNSRLNSKYTILSNQWGLLSYEVVLPTDLEADDMISVQVVSLNAKNALIDDINLNFYSSGK